MNEIEKKATGRQLFYSLLTNRQHKNPFNLQLFNVNYNETSFKTMEKHMPLLRYKKNPFLITENTFTSIYPMEKLLYLSPDSENILSNYDSDDIYIVGGIVDKGPCLPLSLTKANKLGIRHARLPLDEYVKFYCGSHKRLRIDSIVDILLNWKETNDWNKAFEKIPNYKLANKRCIDDK